MNEADETWFTPAVAWEPGAPPQKKNRAPLKMANLKDIGLMEGHCPSQ